MNNHLETFIKNNKMEFDALQPSPAIWGSLETNLVKSNFVNSNWIKGKFSWIKYFVLSSAIVGTVYYFNRPKEIVSPMQSVAIKGDVRGLSTNDPEKSPKPVFESAVLPVLLEEKKTSTKVELESTEELEENQLSAEETVLPTSTKTFVSIPTPIKKNYRKDGSFMDTVFAGIQSLEINANKSDINIITHSGSELIINAEEAVLPNKVKSEKRDGDLLNLIFEKNGSKLLVNISKKENTKFKLKNINNRAGVLDLEVPEALNIIIKSAFGDVKLNGLKNNSTELLMSSGDLNVKNCEGNLIAKLSYGGFISTNTVGKIELTMSSGDTYVEKHSGDLVIRSSYGDQHINNSNGNLNIITSSGDVSIRNSDGDCKIVSSYGDIKLDSVQGNPTIISSSGDIKGERVHVKESMNITSSYGDINIDLNNDFNNLDFDMQSKFGKMKVDMENHIYVSDKKLQVPGGPISIKTVTSSGDQIFR